MTRSPRIVTVVTLLVVTATLLPVVGVAATGHDDTAEVTHPTDTLPRNDTTIRLHRVPNGTGPTTLPDHVAIDEPSDPIFFLGDRLVISVQSGGLAADVSNASGATLTERFAATQNGSRLWVVQTNPTPQRERKVIDLSDAANITVVEGDAPATYHVVVDTWAVETVYGEPADPDVVDAELRPENEFYVGFDGDMAGETAPNRTIRVGEADIDVPTGYGDQVRRLEPVPNATVTGDAVLPPSTPVTVELRNATTGTVVASDRATVERSDGGDATEYRFAASLDLTGEHGEGYELRVRSNETGISDPIPVTVRQRTASLAFRNDTTQWGTTVDDVTLTYGGFVVLHPAGESDTRLGASSYVYPGDEPERVGVQFDDPIESRTTVVAVAYRDVNRNGEFDGPDEPYRVDGSPVTATAVIEPPADPATDTSPPTTPATGTTPAASNTTTTRATSDTPTTPTLGLSGPPDTDDGGSVPGFGVPATVAALAGVCALVVRRRR